MEEFLSWFRCVFRYNQTQVSLLSYRFFMNRKIFFAIILFCIFWLFTFEALWVGKYFRIRGYFVPDDNWTLGHPGKVSFDIGTTNSGFAPGIDPDGYLSGSLWLGNVWWTTFNHADVSVERPRVLCDDNVFRNANYICPLTGFAWSENAGWVSLSGAFIDGGSGVYYSPASGLIEGFGHSRALWWIPFYAQAGTPVDTGSTSQTGVTLDGIGLNFIGKIAVIGNIAGTRIYNLPNQQVGYIFSSINHAEILNTIRKNIALISRNVASVDLVDSFSTKFDFMIQNGSDYDTSTPWWTWPAAKRSIIITGADIILDQAQIGIDTSAERALIALKDVNGNGGNIIITQNVERIYWFLYAEGVIYSGEKSAGVIVPYVGSWVWNIPASQLYIRWALISKNTIWWALQSPSVCPVVINECTPAEAQIYDFNYFRAYDPNDPSQRHVPYSDPRFNVASMVIDYNQWLTSNPPPGILSVLQ